MRISSTFTAANTSRPKTAESRYLLPQLFRGQGVPDSSTDHDALRHCVVGGRLGGPPLEPCSVFRTCCGSAPPPTGSEATRRLLRRRADAARRVALPPRHAHGRHHSMVAPPFTMCTVCEKAAYCIVSSSIAGSKP